MLPEDAPIHPPRGVPGELAVGHVAGDRRGGAVAGRAIAATTLRVEAHEVAAAQGHACLLRAHRARRRPVGIDQEVCEPARVAAFAFSRGRPRLHTHLVAVRHALHDLVQGFACADAKLDPRGPRPPRLLALRHWGRARSRGLRDPRRLSSRAIAHGPMIARQPAQPADPARRRVDRSARASVESMPAGRSRSVRVCACSLTGVT
jgi:hypothetical protein